MRQEEAEDTNFTWVYGKDKGSTCLGKSSSGLAPDLTIERNCQRIASELTNIPLIKLETMYIRSHHVQLRAFLFDPHS